MRMRHATDRRTDTAHFIKMRPLCGSQIAKMQFALVRRRRSEIR